MSSFSCAEVAGRCFGDLVHAELRVADARRRSADPSEASTRPGDSTHDEGGLSTIEEESHEYSLSDHCIFHAKWRASSTRDQQAVRKDAVFTESVTFKGIS
eukprot:934115-Pyramimonas_sp.AAC.1